MYCRLRLIYTRCD